MGAAEECLRKSYVKLYYVPPLQPQVPQNCDAVLWTKYPEITFTEGKMQDPLFGFELLCASPVTSGAGGVILLLQVTTYLKWELSFINTQGKMVREIHSVFVSMPMMYKLQGPRMALMALSPLKIKLIGYVGMIAKAFKKIDEVETVIAKIVSRKVGFCPKDIKALQDGLKALEMKLNNLLQGAARGSDDIASRMHSRPFDTGRFAGTRLA